ncbi:ribonuclease E [Hyphomonas hirschiana VP5]|uniref:Ribonuclease E n=1 Tax=Hyphomonas hirschiana VP5 TaxID=1280951 RepID=A0A059G0B5_9PROT|nr:ribonuclease E [Hyphomonas hirschiana VP5]
MGHVRAIIIVFDGGGGLFSRFLQQQFAVSGGQLVIIGVNLAEGEKTVAVATILDKSRLERRLHTGHFGEIDVSAELFVAGCLKVEIVNLAVVDDGHPRFFGVGSVDQHQSAH